MKGMIRFTHLSHKLFFSFVLVVFSGEFVMSSKTVGIKPETRNHRGYFVDNAAYELVSIEKSGWALICVDDAVCHYVDPDNLLMSKEDDVLQAR